MPDHEHDWQRGFGTAPFCHDCGLSEPDRETDHLTITDQQMKLVSFTSVVAVLCQKCECLLGYMPNLDRAQELFAEHAASVHANGSGA